MNKKFLDKVVGQLVSETRLDYSVGIFTPFRELPFQITISDSRFFSSPSPPASFTSHLTEVYSISEWGEMMYLWGKYVKTLRDKIEGNDGVINESNGMNKKFLNKVVDQLVSEIRMSDDYKGDEVWVWRNIFVPFSFTPISFQSFLPGPLSTSRFPPLYILFTQHCEDVYGLNKEEIEYVWDEYVQYIKDNIESNEHINEAHISKTPENDFTNQVIDMLDHPPYLYTLESMGLTEEDIVKVFKKMYGDIVKVKYKKGYVRVKDELRNTLYMESLDNDRTLWSKWEWYPRSDDWRRFVDERGDRRYRTRSGVIVYDEQIEDCCLEELEDGFYPPLPTNINEGINNQYVNESPNSYDEEWYYQYVFDSKYLSKVLEQLLSETKIEWDTQENGISIKVGWDPYIGYQRDVSYPLFQKHCKEVYSLKYEEISDIFTLYMMDMKERLRKVVADKKNLTEEIMSPNLPKHVTHKGKLNFIDRITDLMMDETYVVDMEPPKGSNSDWYVEGMRKIYFYKSGNSLGRDDVEGIITPGESFNEFGDKYMNETFSAIFSHLRRFSSDNIGTEMEIYIWAEYLYRLREKYFGGGEGPPLAKMKQM